MKHQKDTQVENEMETTRYWVLEGYTGICQRVVVMSGGNKDSIRQNRMDMRN